MSEHRMSFLSEYENKIFSFLEAKGIPVTLDENERVCVERAAFTKAGLPSYFLTDLRRCFKRKIRPNFLSSSSDLDRFLKLCDEESKAKIKKDLFFGVV